MLCQRMASPGFWVWNFQFRLQTKGFPEGKFALYKMGKCQYCRKFIGWRHDLIQEKDKSKRGSCSKSTTKNTKLEFKRQKKNQIWCFQHVFTWPLDFMLILNMNNAHTFAQIWVNNDQWSWIQEIQWYDTPFWSWDIGLSGACWPKWPRKSSSPQKITFSERNIFWGGSGPEVPAFSPIQSKGQEYPNAYH